MRGALDGQAVVLGEDVQRIELHRGAVADEFAAVGVVGAVAGPGPLQVEPGAVGEAKMAADDVFDIVARGGGGVGRGAAALVREGARGRGGDGDRGGVIEQPEREIEDVYGGGGQDAAA